MSAFPKKMIWEPGLGLCVFKIRQNVDRNNKFSLSLLHLSIYLCIKCKHINSLFKASLWIMKEWNHAISKKTELFPCKYSKYDNPTFQSCTVFIIFTFIFLFRKAKHKQHQVHIVVFLLAKGTSQLFRVRKCTKKCLILNLEIILFNNGDMITI